MPRSLVRWRRGLVTCIAILALAGCVPSSFSQTAYQREAGTATSLLAAAATTIEFTHTGKLDRRYAEASMVIYRQQLADLPDLAGLDGAPDAAITGPLAAALDDARVMLRDPCLGDGCDWERQVSILTAISQDLDESAS